MKVFHLALVTKIIISFDRFSNIAMNPNDLFIKKNAAKDYQNGYTSIQTKHNEYFMYFNDIKTCTDNNVWSPKSVILESDLGHYTI